MCRSRSDNFSKGGRTETVLNWSLRQVHMQMLRTLKPCQARQGCSVEKEPARSLWHSGAAVTLK